MYRSREFACVRSTIGMVLGGWALVFTSLASGQEAPSAAKLEEVVVTAQKRSESLQRVPIAISALGADELAQRGIGSITDLKTGKVPTIRMAPFAGQINNWNIVIRGVSAANGQDLSFENAVPTYIDDVYYGRTAGLGLEINDIERMEILRGPQGTLFGKNAVGGAVRIVSKAPTGEFGLRSTVDIGNYGLWKAIAHIDLPSVAGIATKLDVLATDNDGWQDNPGEGQKDWARLKSKGGKFSARAEPTEALVLDFAADYTDVDATQVFNQLLSTDDPFIAVAFPTETSRQKDTIPTYRPFNDERYWGARLTVTWELSNTLSIKSISAYRDDKTYLYNTPGGLSALPGAFIGSSVPYVGAPVVVYDITHDQASEELQLIGTLDELQWVAGLFFMKEDGAQIQNTTYGTGWPNAQLALVGGFPFPVSLGDAIALDPPAFIPGTDTGAKIKNKAEGIFGQATWRPEALAEKWAFTAGLRVSRDTKKATRPVGEIYPSAFATVPIEVCPCSTRKLKDTKTLPMASVAYAWNQDSETYAKYATGYQAGGFGIPSRTFEPVDATRITSYELGHKTTLFEGRVRFNIAGFYQRFKDSQQSVQTTSASVQEWFNGPTVKGKGIELDSSFLITEGLTFNLVGSYGDYETSAVANPFPPPGNTAGGVPLFANILQAPKWTGSASVFWDIAHVNYGTWRLTTDLSTTDKYFTVPNATVPVPGYTTFNGRLGLYEIPLSGDLTMNVNVWGNNLFNKDYKNYLYTAPGLVPGSIAVQSVFGEPRTYGVQLGVNFK